MIIHKLPVSFVQNQFGFQPVGYFDVSLFRNVQYLNLCEQAIKTGQMIILDFKNLDPDQHDFWGTYLKMYGDNLTFKDYQSYCTLPEIKTFRDSTFMGLFREAVECIEVLKSDDTLCFEIDESSRNATVEVIKKLKSIPAFAGVKIMIDIRDPAFIKDVVNVFGDLDEFDVLTDLAFHATRHSLRVYELDSKPSSTYFKFHEVFETQTNKDLLEKNINAFNKLIIGQEVDYKDFV